MLGSIVENAQSVETAVAQLGCAGSTFGELKAEAVMQKRVERRGKGWFRKPTVYSFNALTGKTAGREVETPVRVVI